MSDNRNDAVRIRSLNELYSVMPWEWYQLHGVDRKDVVFAHSFDLLAWDMLRASGQSEVAVTYFGQELNRLGLSQETLASFRANRIYGIVSESALHPSRMTLASLVAQGRRYGAFQQMVYLIREFRTSYALLFERYDLSEDGVVSRKDMSLEDLHWDVASRYNSVIQQGRRCVERMEEFLKHFFGEESVEYSNWKDLDGDIYDKDLSFAFCYDVRNSIEHGFTLLSVVNVDMSRDSLGLAINLDSGLLDKDGLCSNDGIKKDGTRKRLKEFRDERVARGETPWLSVAGTLRNWKLCVENLYLAFLEAFVGHSEAVPGTVSFPAGFDGRDCLIWHRADRGRGTGDDPYSGIDRLYQLPPFDFINQLKSEGLEVVRSIEDVCSHEEIQKLKEIIARWDE